MELTGLTTQEALARQAAGQGNRGGPPTGRSYWQIFRENIFTFINNVLFGLGIALVALGLPSDALVSVGVIMVNVLVSVVQEIRAKRMLDKIALLTRPTATVIRDGAEKTLDPVEIVSGDLLVLNPGDQATVDGTIMGEGSLEMDESLLTGESDLIRKRAGDKILSGSFCVTGSGYYTAEQVGQDSYANQLTSQARAFRRMLTPLQQQINLAIRVILVMAVYYEVLLVVNTIL
ncbi:MAG: haloacid dehalogenase, partial [Anaerolineaceae bacterium]|nr:haloacid dehalogenase [Anaerolineaceae bacterium]